MLITKALCLKAKKRNKEIFFLCSFLLFQTAYSQIGITKPILNFSPACPSASFNNFSITFSYSPTSNLNSDNNFNIELSDAQGSFSSPVLLTTSSATTANVTVAFAFPTNINGISYRIRVKSTSPVATSPNSDPFEARYASYVMPFTINNNNPNQTFCENSSFELSIDDGPNSPLQYPQLTYKWYKDGSAIAGQTSNTLLVSSEGTYYVEINYGNCTNDIAKSNFVNFTSIPTPNLIITTDTGLTEFCASEWIVLSSTNITASNIYHWYYNGTEIPNETSSSYTATEAGNYYLTIEGQGCNLTSNTLFLTTIDISGFETIPSETEIELTAGESITILAQGASEYEWSINNTIVGSSDSYTTDKEEVIQLTATMGGCLVNKNFIISFKKIPANLSIPNTITPNNDTVNDKWNLNGFANNDDTEVVIFTASNEEIYRKKNYSDDWPLEGFVKNNTVYYYKILQNNSIVAKGTLSILTK